MKKTDLRDHVIHLPDLLYRVWFQSISRLSDDHYQLLQKQQATTKHLQATKDYTKEPRKEKKTCKNKDFLDKFYRLNT